MADLQPTNKYPAVLAPLSRVSLRVRALFEGKEIGTATGFTYLTEGGMFFLTNWHVVTGRSPTTGKTIHPMAAIPDELIVGLPFRRIANSERSVMWWQDGTIRLYKDAERKLPTWFEHPAYGEKVDVVAIPFGFEGEHLDFVPANDASLKLQPVVLFPSLSVYVLGFPLGLSGGASLPIWKHATIASEPEFDLAPEPEKAPEAKLPMIYIDTATKQGMSGAPVFVNEVGSWIRQKEDGSRVHQLDGIGRKLVGVYASRIHADNEMEAQLGIVWKAETIEEIIAGGRVGRSSFPA
ncbi:MAG: hypothetical protein ACKVPX_02180 [Myxococcaceae bacterium]